LKQSQVFNRKILDAILKEGFESINGATNERKRDLEMTKTFFGFYPLKKHYDLPKFKIKNYRSSINFIQSFQMK